MLTDREADSCYSYTVLSLPLVMTVVRTGVAELNKEGVLVFL